MSRQLLIAFLGLLSLSAGCAASTSPSGRTSAQVIPGAAPGTAPRCAPSGGDTTGTVYFEFQVDRPVTPRRGSPEPPPLGGEVLVQFVVDTAGLVDVSTVKVMKSERATATRRLQEALPTLRFEAAIRQGCRVHQLVQRDYS